jgi:YebC/PmpR family DNA-binding regulatory protein
MSGHSHWARIKHKKGATDVKRGKLWSKLARHIIIAAKAGGGKPEENLSLRYAIDKAKEANMPSDTIDRAIKKGTGELGGVNYEEVNYEGYGPGGVAILVACLTDNRNRTAPEIRKIFEQRNLALGGAGSVAWMFKQKGLMLVSAAVTTEEKLMEVALEAGAEDIALDGDAFEITCLPASFEAVKKALKDAKIETQSTELAMIPQNYVHLEGEDAKKLLALIEALEDHDDVQNVYANFDISDDVIEEASK